MEEIPFPTTWDVKNPVNNGINYHINLEPQTTIYIKWMFGDFQPFPM